MDFPPSLKCSWRAVAGPGVQGGTGRAREGVQRPLVPVVGETTKGSSQTFFYVYVAAKLLSLDLLNAGMHPRSKDSFVSNGRPMRQRKRNGRRITLATERLTLTLLPGLAMTQREFRQSEGTAPGS